MNCDLKQEGLKSTFTWLVDGAEAESAGANVQVALGGRRLYVMEAQPDNQATYQCIVRNSAGENKKNFKLLVLVPPEFRDREFEQNIEVNAGNPWTLTCHVTGSPTPEVTWQRDGRPILDNSDEGGVTFSENNQVLRIEQMSNGQSNQRYTCQAKNKAGAISRDFFLQIIAPPEISQDGDRTVIEVFQGSSVTLQCPVSVVHGIFELQWLREGRPLPTDVVNMQISLDRTRLVMVNVQKADETIYTCVARNPAGEASREFQLIVLVPPKILGKLVEDITVIEGQSLSLNCEFEADPDRQVSWQKDGRGLRETAELINEDTAVYVASAEKEDAGSYFCSVKNKAGMVEKTFNVRVLLKPEVRGSDEVATIEVLVRTPITLDCPVNDPIGVDFSWSRHEVPVVSGMDNVQLLAGGRHLHIGSVKQEDAGPFTCIAKNDAGQSSKKYKLVVLVPPSIIGEGGSYTVIENNSLVLPCEVEGVPMPTITWTKDGSSVTVLPSVELLSEGQQLKIINAASDVHRGGYVCTATNKVGTADLGFDVDVISKPSVGQAVKDTIEVIKGDSANFRCPITDKKFRGDITWLRDFRPLPEEEKYIVAQSGRKLHLTDAQPSDEGSYSCRLKNDAGESRVDFKLIVLVPPEIIMLDKDKNRTLIENATLTLSCPATGKPDPTIEWLKDGERLTADNVAERISSAQIIGNDLRIAIAKVPHSGRFTCEAKNKAGVAEQDVTVFVMTPPRIEREGIPSEIDGVTANRVTLSCPAYGRPMPSVTWLKAGRPLDDSADVYFSANGQKLHFLSLTKDHIDHYTCVARNAAGEDKRDFSLRLLEAPTISGPNIPRKVQVNVGRTATLNCPATGSPEPTISWLKNGQPLETEGNVVILAGGKQLQIGDARLDDDARYTCIATNPIGAVDLDVFVEVAGAPKIAGDQLETVEVIVNQAHDLNCEVSGTEPLDVEWQRGGQTVDVGGIRGGGSYLQISSRGRKLHLLSAQVTDTSRYTCVARNTAGEARKIIDLRVLVPPIINETLSSKPLQTVIPESQFRIECKVHGIPQPEIVWRKDDEIFHPTSDDPRVQLMYENQTIWIRTASHSDAGRYSCEATNKVGKASKDFIVRLTAPPTVDKGTVEMEVIVGDFVILTCQVTSGTGKLNVNWLINDRPVDVSQLGESVSIEDRRIEIREARLSDTSKYTCVVENEAGQAKKTFELTVLEPPRFLDTINLSPSIILGRPLVLDCSVAGTPKPTIAWTKVICFLFIRASPHVTVAPRKACISASRRPIFSPSHHPSALVLSIDTPNAFLSSHVFLHTTKSMKADSHFDSE
uniref:Ig-like domain-containing protein n=1 Tax=Plectus sambesii TaxID=2011161 RepID=A0A914V1Q2_9BILA